ncbi:hypothetical protein LCGC14_2954940, partial [marine sediment metagenome]
EYPFFPGIIRRHRACTPACCVVSSNYRTFNAHFSVGQAVGGLLFGVLSIVLALRLTRRLVKEKAMKDFLLTPDPTFRVPLSAHTSCNGWMGVYRRD